MTTEMLKGASPNLSVLFRHAIHEFGDNIAFRQGGEKWSYRQVGDMATALSGALRSNFGVQKGDRVALMAQNSIEFIATAVAVIWAGGVLVNVNPFYTERELTHQLNDAGVEIIVVGQSSVPTLRAGLTKTKIKTVIFVGEGEMISITNEFLNVVTTDFKEALRLGDNLCLEPVACEADDIAVLQYTGGTTGLSKGAILRHRNIANNSQQIKIALTPPLGLGDEIVLTALPLYHIFAFTVNFITFFTMGATNNLISDPSDIDKIVQVMNDYPITAMTGVNTLYANILTSEHATTIDWSNFKVAIGGGSAILPGTSARWKALCGVHILEGYGMTETSPVLTVVPPEIDEFTSTVGLPLPSTDIVIFNDDDELVPDGQLGEICILGPQVMSGYWKSDDIETSAFNPQGYFKSGDIGFIDDRGFIKIIDRKKDLILVSGFNVYPNEVEAVASTFPSIIECACIGVPHEIKGEEVKLFVVTTGPQSFDAGEFRCHCRKGLVAYKVPKLIEVVDSLPKSTVGKILRRKLKIKNER